MLLIRTILTKLTHYPRLPRSIYFNLPKYKFSNNKKLLDQQLHTYADTINSQNITQDYSQIANNYIQLQQNSFTQFAKQNKNDPQLMLMFLSSFQNTEQIVQYLPMLYPHVDYYQASQLLLLMEKILAFKPKNLPKVPFPKPLENIQSILVIMSQIYKADKLLEWLKLVPIYTGKQYYVLLMGYFSILQKLSPQIKSRNRSLWAKCHQKISSILSDEQVPVQIKAGILILAFELDYGQARPLLLIPSIDYDSIDPYKNCLLFINMSKYILRRKDTQTGLSAADSQKIQKITKKTLSYIIDSITKLDLIQFIKIQLFIEIWSVIKQLKQIKGIYQGLVNKMSKLITHKKFMKAMKDLNIQQLLIIFEAFQKHKINNEKSLKFLLVLFSTQLNNLTTNQFIRLLKCLVTYVRQSQQYLINVRQILQQRKNQFNQQQVLKINQILRRVQVLFPQKFALR